MIIVENKAVWTYKVEDLSIHSILVKYRKQNTQYWPPLDWGFVCRLLSKFSSSLVSHEVILPQIDWLQYLHSLNFSKETCYFLETEAELKLKIVTKTDPSPVKTLLTDIIECFLPHRGRLRTITAVHFAAEQIVRFLEAENWIWHYFVYPCRYAELLSM